MAIISALGQARTTGAPRTDAFASHEAWQALQDALEFTRLHQSLAEESRDLREAISIKHQLPRVLQPIRSGDAFAGRIELPLVGFGPEPGGMGFFCRTGAVQQALDKAGLDAVQAAEVLNMIQYWEKESTSAKARAAFPDWLKERMPSDNWQGEAGLAFPLYRIAGIQLDFRRLLALGLGGLAADIRDRMPKDEEAARFFAAAEIAVLALQDVIGQYAAQAKSEQLSQIGQDLDHIRTMPPATFRQALQLVWLYALAAGTMNYGRLDVVLGPFLAEDIREGRITQEESARLLAEWYRLVNAFDNRWNHRVVVGGKGRPSTQDADVFALAAIEAARQARLITPQVTLRFHEGQNKALMEAALDCLAEGVTFPILYDDDTLIPSVAEAFGVPLDEAEQYLPYGCGEYMLWNRSVSTPNSVINLTKCLEAALNQGCEFSTGRQIGPVVPALAAETTLEEVWSWYTAQVDYAMDASAEAHKIIYQEMAAAAPLLFVSALMDDCLDKGRAVLRGGARLVSAAVESYGNATTADSFAAMEHEACKERRHTLLQIVEAVRGNWANRHRLQEDLKAAPKFGNDNDLADKWAVRVHEQACLSAIRAGIRHDMDPHLVVVINNSANTDLGRHTGASANGRSAGEPLSNGNNPTPGADRSGLTAFLSSLARLRTDIHAGAVQNIKLAPSMFTRHRTALEQMLAVYFRKGGGQAMITVVNRQDLIDAMQHPEEYGHVMVRVGGLSARFVDLPREVQLEIIGRTLYA